MHIIRLSKLTEGAAQRANPNINYGLGYSDVLM